MDYFCKITLKLLHLLQISDLNIIFFSSASYKCTQTILKYSSYLIKSEFYSLDLTSLSPEDNPLDLLKQILNDYIKNGLKNNKNAILFINMNEMKEITLNSLKFSQRFGDLMLFLSSLEKGYDVGCFILKEVLEEYIQNSKLSDNYKHLNNYHHLYLLKEKLATKIKIIFNMDINHSLKISFVKHGNHTFLGGFQQLLKNYTRFYIYFQRVNENSSTMDNEIFTSNIEKIYSLQEIIDKGFKSDSETFNMETGRSAEFLKKVKLAYLFEIEESKILLNVKKNYSNMLSFQQFFTLICYTYDKIRQSLLNKFENEKKTGIMGKIFDLQNAKFDKFNKEINKTIREKENLEKDLCKLDEQIKENRSIVELRREAIEKINSKISQKATENLQLQEEIEKKKYAWADEIKNKKEYLMHEEDVNYN